ncbi:hypothetical protein GCM10018782_18470 [Streptomyces griseoaurantiacus]|nr:hypothetical protein GCM10018782_18470 [Streptomyces griseoaurantiacus]
MQGVCGRPERSGGRQGSGTAVTYRTGTDEVNPRDNRRESWRKGTAVADDQKAKSKGEQAKGKLKEAAGRAVGNERMEAEGRAEQAKGDARQAKEKAKDVFKH